MDAVERRMEERPASNDNLEVVGYFLGYRYAAALGGMGEISCASDFRLITDFLSHL
jgi:hypothetical protein